MHSSFEKQFESTRKLAIFGGLLSAAFGIGVTGFLLWAIYKVMQHFAII